MNPWHRNGMVAFDTETTAPEPNTARLVTATVALIRPGMETETLTWLINPGCEIPEEASAIHGITTEAARENGQPPEDAVREIATALLEHSAFAPVVAFNAAYDFTVLDREMKRHLSINYVAPDVLVVDPHVCDKALDKYRKGKRTLTAVTEHYGVRLGGAHDATEDALGAARVAWALAERYPDDLQIDLTELHARQKQWRAEQAASLQRYFRRKDPEAVVNGEWPLQNPPPDWSPDQHPHPREDAA